MNMRMPYEIESPEGYDAVYPKTIAKFLASLGSSNVDASPAGKYGSVDNVSSHLVDLINTKYILVLKKDETGKVNPNEKIPKKFQSEKYTPIFSEKSVVVLENKHAFEKAFMVYNY